MEFQRTKLSLLIFALAFGGAMTGCTGDKNSESDLVENPDDNPVADPEPEPEPEVEPNMPLYQGVVLFKLHELDSTETTPRIVRSKREVSGSIISVQKQSTPVDADNWTDAPDPLLKTRVFNATGNEFVEFNGHTYTFEGDSNNYVYRFPNTDLKLDVDHFLLNAASQNVSDTLQQVFLLPELASIMQELPQFDGSEDIHLETLEFFEPGIMYNAGKSNDTNCLMWDGTVSSETPETTVNCNFVAFDDGTTGLSGTNLEPLVSEDPASATKLKGSVLMTSNFRLIADSGSTTQGDVVPGDTTNIIGGWTMTTLGAKDAILVQLADTNQTQGYVNQSQWTDPSAFYLVQDIEKLRIAPVYEAGTILKKNNWLIGNQGLEKVFNSVNLNAN